MFSCNVLWKIICFCFVVYFILFSLDKLFDFILFSLNKLFACSISVLVAVFELHQQLGLRPERLYLLLVRLQQQVRNYAIYLLYVFLYLIYLVYVFFPCPTVIVGTIRYNILVLCIFYPCLSVSVGTERYMKTYRKPSQIYQNLYKT